MLFLCAMQWFNQIETVVTIYLTVRRFGQHLFLHRTPVHRATEPYFPISGALVTPRPRQLCSGKTSRQTAYALWSSALPERLPRSTIRIHFIIPFHFTFQFSFCVCGFVSWSRTGRCHYGWCLRRRHGDTRS